MLTEKERSYSARIDERIGRLRSFLDSHELGPTDPFTQWYEFLSSIRLIQGNLSNDIGFVATLLTKQYLSERFNIPHFDAADKARGASGIDIDVRTQEGLRIVAEIKTNVPYKDGDFGAKQAELIRRDLAKLDSAQADLRFFFVTEESAFEILTKPRSAWLMPKVRVVLLPSGGFYSRQALQVSL